MLESNPFSFWCEKMPENELNHWEYQNEIVQKSDEFQQAEMLFQSNQHDKAVEYYKMYVERNKEKMSPHSLRSAFVRLGKILSQQAKYQEALDYHFQCVEINVALCGEDSVEVAVDYMAIGSVLNELGQYKKALDCPQKALTTFNACCGENDIPLATCADYIGDVFKNKKNDKVALQCYIKSMKIHQAIYGENHFEMTNCYGRIGMSYYRLEEYDEALSSISRKL